MHIFPYIDKADPSLRLLLIFPLAYGIFISNWENPLLFEYLLFLYSKIFFFDYNFLLIILPVKQTARATVMGSIFT